MSETAEKCANLMTATHRSLDVLAGGRERGNWFWGRTEEEEDALPQRTDGNIGLN